MLFSLCLNTNAQVINVDTTQVFFENDSYFVGHSDLLRLKAHLTQFHIIDSILCVGYASTKGLSPYNFKLSNKRAVRISKFFDSIYDSNLVINFEGKGELSGISKQTRKVDIIIYFREFDIKEDVRNIVFRPGTDIILEESKKNLQQLLEYVVSKSESHFLLTGHICCPTTDDYKLDGYNRRTGSNSLSLDRAKAVFSYLINNGVDSTRIRYSGKAYSEPLGGESHLNRRVEIKEFVND